MPQTIAVVAETKDGSVRKVTFEMLAEARRLVQAAGGGTVTAIVPGRLGAGEVDLLAQQGADRVYQLEGAALDTYASDTWAQAVCRAVEAVKPEVLLIGGTALGKDLAPRVAARLQCGLASDCVEFEWKGARSSPDAPSSPAGRSARSRGTAPGPPSPPSGPTRSLPPRPSRPAGPPSRRSPWATSPRARG